MNHKCKMCGGVLTPAGKEKIITCAYCGTKQTLPCPDSERIAGLYEKADGYRRNLEFDKALALYEEILNEDSTDAECYWLALLCEFGIEYVEGITGRRSTIQTENQYRFCRTRFLDTLVTFVEHRLHLTV